MQNNPNSKELLAAKTPLQVPAREVPTQAADEHFDADISIETPLQDYTRLIKAKVQVDDVTDDEILNDRYEKITAAARETIGKLLFSDPPPSLETQARAAALLSEYKIDACFYNPYEYNDWIVEVRDELLKRNMLQFWRETIVKHELGPCWARDSDLFDDMEDPEPEEFYNYAGCVAPFSKTLTGTAAGTAQSSTSSATVAVPNPAATAPPATSSATVAAAATVPSPAAGPKAISLETPAQDYTAILQQQLEEDGDDDAKLKGIFAATRTIVWDLLFKEASLPAENYAKAATLLEAYKCDACFYDPHSYNEWIPKVRDELFTRKHFGFWKDIIVKKQLGLCWYKDSDYFDDTEDTKPIEFYKSGDELMK